MRVPSATLGWVVMMVAACVPPSGEVRRGRSPVELLESARPMFPLVSESYAARDVGGMPLSPAVAAFLEACGPARAPLLTHDGSFDLLSHLYGVDVQPGEVIGPAAFETWLAWRLGAMSRPSRVVVVQVSAEELGARQREAWTQLCARFVTEPTTFGVTSGAGADGTGRIALALAPRWLDLAPLPRNLVPGSSVTVSGRLRVADRGLLLYVDRDTRPGVLPVPTSDDGTFSVEVPLPARKGRVFLEFVLDGSAAPHASLLLVPLDLGLPEPPALDDWMLRPKSNPPNEAELPGAILSALDTVRPLAGLASLERSERLAVQAGRWLASRPTEGPLAPRRVIELPGEGRAVLLVGRVEKVDRDVRALVWSPWVRHALQDAEVTHVGVAVLAEGGGRFLFAAVLGSTGVLP